ncbi:Protein MIZU-KUSSEI 1 [Forsythia ovata]|uniref:Protein MIZU-KUSSEI 1 n=1 Tax=Forsythia ovata TaxID=205694 RepID=A0ABD1SLZ9_9LAMI
MRHEQSVGTLPRTSSCKSTNKIIPANYVRLSSLNPETSEEFHEGLLVRRTSTAASHAVNRGRTGFSGLLRSLLHIISFPTILPTCRWLNIPTQLSITPSLGRKVTGTLFGHRRGHVTFAVQDDPRSEPVLLIELAVSTFNSGERDVFWASKDCPGVRERPAAISRWAASGEAVQRANVDYTVSVGAGVIPVVDDGRKNGASEGELLYMRARFERVVGSRDSEAFYMLNPDGNGGPELSIFLLRI